MQRRCAHPRETDPKDIGLPGRLTAICASNAALAARLRILAGDRIFSYAGLTAGSLIWCVACSYRELPSGPDFTHGIRRSSIGVQAAFRFLEVLADRGVAPHLVLSVSAVGSAGKSVSPTGFSGDCDADFGAVRADTGSEDREETDVAECRESVVKSLCFASSEGSSSLTAAGCADG